MSAIDRISLGIIWDRLIAITDETLNTLVRTSFSANVRESYDLSCTLFDANARLIAQGSYSVPSFTGTAPETIRAMLERFPPETLQPRDVIATNDPWIGTGHLYDINVMRPVFRDGKIIAYSMSITHLPDIGGLGFSATAKQIYEEGLRIPVCKLVEAGVPNALLLDIVKNNVRVPDQTLGDLHANIACNEVSARLLIEFMDEYKLSSLDDVADQIIESSELALRKAIETIPDGSYHHAIQIEGEREPLTLSIRLDVRGDHIHGDFTGSSPEVNIGINVPLSYAKAFVAYTIKCLLAPNLPNNLGNVRPITVSAPANCILNAKPPFPTGGRHIIGHFVTPLVMGALAQIVPNAVQADSGMLSLVNVQGRGPRGRGISSIYFSSGGFGALDGLDGANAVPSPSNMTGTSIEVWEELTGMTVVSKALRPDSGGNGRNRGGLGQEIVFRNDTGAPLTISCLAGRTEFPAMGYAGGQPGALRTYLIDGQEVHPKGRYQLAPGGILTILEPGGGGFGPPGERARAAIEQDVKMGFMTAQGARQAYGLDVADPVPAKNRGAGVTRQPAAPDEDCAIEIDLRSDLTSPSHPDILAAMQDAARAPGGFDFRDGAYVQKLEQETAALLGKEDAIWFPTCTMANLVVVLLQTGPDGAVVTQADNHVATTERDSITDIARRKLIGLPPTGGLVTPKAFADAISSDTTIELVVLENTHNRSGGLPLPAGYAKQIGALAAERGVKLHLDGSRLFNAAIAQGEDPASLCEEAETVSISLNKGLGAPNGAMLAGPSRLMERAGTLRRQLGGGVRPLNIMAAAGLAALRQRRDLSRDHHLARSMASALAGVPGCAVDLKQVQTNIILVRLDIDRAGTAAFVADLARHGVGALDFDAGCIRLCVHCGISENAVPRVAQAFADIARTMEGRDR